MFTYDILLYFFCIELTEVPDADGVADDCWEWRKVNYCLNAQVKSIKSPM